VVEPSWWETYTGQGLVPAGLSGDKWAQPVLVNGSIGPKVAQVQTLLKTAGVYHGSISGTFDDATESAVQSWQIKLGIEPDGAWGPTTARATASFLTFIATAVKLPQPPLSAGDHGWDVHRLQVALQALGYRVPVHGFYLASTIAAVKRFDNTCPGTHGWPGRSWHTHQNTCLAFYLGLAHKGVIR
jgi:peptidoglycan hydrolase-like protein with peptidoglycan-binding domain